MKIYMYNQDEAINDVIKETAVLQKAMGKTKLYL